MAAPTLSAYTQGIDHTLTALGWLAGALTVLAGFAAAFALIVWLISPLEIAARRRLTTHRLRREHQRSGRA